MHARWYISVALLQLKHDLFTTSLLKFQHASSHAANDVNHMITRDPGWEASPRKTAATGFEVVSQGWSRAIFYDVSYRRVCIVAFSLVYFVQFEWKIRRKDNHSSQCWPNWTLPSRQLWHNCQITWRSGLVGMSLPSVDSWCFRMKHMLALVPGATVTKSPQPPVVFCQVGVSHIYVTELQPPVIFRPTQVSHICSGSGDFRKSQWMSY